MKLSITSSLELALVPVCVPSAGLINTFCRSYCLLPIVLHDTGNAKRPTPDIQPKSSQGHVPGSYAQMPYTVNNYNNTRSAWRLTAGRRLTHASIQRSCRRRQTGKTQERRKATAAAEKDTKCLGPWAGTRRLALEDHTTGCRWPCLLGTRPGHTSRQEEGVGPDRGEEAQSRGSAGAASGPRDEQLKRVPVGRHDDINTAGHRQGVVRYFGRVARPGKSYLGT